MKKLLMVIAAISTATLAGCERGPDSPRGFSFPPGDVESGRITFLALHCNACHSVADIDQLDVDPATGKAPSGMSIKLGGSTTRVKTYAELVTSIINPSHRMAKGYAKEMIQTDGKSNMPNYNSLMSVSELIDVVTFLESNYTLEPYIPTQYPLVY